MRVLGLLFENLGVLGTLFGIFLGGWLLKRIVDSWLLLGILAIAVVVFLKNIDTLRSAPPVPGKVGTLLNTALIGAQSAASYRSCLDGYIAADPGNALLQAEATRCESQRSARYWACMPEVKGDVLILDKQGHCLAEAGEVWKGCAEKALSIHASTYTPVQNCAQGKTIDILRSVAGSQSGQSP